ncbi:putative membrane protein [Hydrogenivirga caldilitoris]|uniref:Putative membrane protein n=1 Tax=Hydrogenivirga caldilitoris TaxID=246264 RepID=A0A497XPN4_9AQUI|nr:exopolysaccharide Pel transporter PelG [Hydrogenivirga caldilitoris]RLJ70110.1 putative membrane protein [Hydrogenivirga caldilitoris]
MAGISIELKKILQRESLLNLLAATGYSAVLSAGNWVIAVASIFIFSLIASTVARDPSIPIIYQVYITYTVALSLIISGPIQLMFTRYVADRLFEKEVDRVLPNYFGALSLGMFISLVMAMLASLYLFKGEPYYYHLVFSFTVSVLGGLWITNALLTGLKSYKHILISFAVSYLLTGLALIFTARISLFATFVSFYLGQCLLLFLLTYRVVRDYTSDRLFELDFLKKGRSHYSLLLSGFFYNFGIWADKLVFWFSPYTGDPVFANIRSSVVYDIPVIFAYVSLVPGLAIFFLKIEAEFFAEYDNYYRAVREWGRLEDLYRLGNKMIEGAKATFYETLRAQGIAVILILLLEEAVFKLFKLSLVYIPMFNILLIGALLQLSFMVLFALLSYFDRRKDILIISGVFASGNLLLSVLSQILGPYFYGYGYALSLLISSVIGMILVRRFLSEVHYRTFMLAD